MPSNVKECCICSCSERLKIDVSSNDPINKRIKDYCENSYMHGPAGIARSKNIVRFLIWILVFAGGWGMTIWMLHDIIVKYYTYPTTTSVTLNSNATMQFPAVTICNINPIRNSEIDNTSPGLRNVIKGAQSTRTPSVKKWKDKTKKFTFYNEYDDRTKSKLDFEYQYASLSLDKRQRTGHQLEDMLIRCQFKGVNCAPGNFTNFVNYKYGNCYTFNSGVNNSIAASEKTGPLYDIAIFRCWRYGRFAVVSEIPMSVHRALKYCDMSTNSCKTLGLTLELNIEHSEYIGGLANDAGIRLVVHNQTTFPFPEDDGINISPGAKTSVAVSMLSIIRTKPNYGTCKTFSTEENNNYNAWANYTSQKTGYSLKACQKTCLQQFLIQYCQCCSTNYPCSGFAIDSFTSVYNSSVGFCLYSNMEHEKCSQLMTSRYESGTLTCDHCKSPCHETEYKTEISSSFWPSNDYLDDATSDFASSSSTLYANLKSNDSALTRSFMKENGIKVDVYFKHLNYETIETTPSYQLPDLLSDIGGQLGLWIGMSVVSTFEVFELVGDLFTIAILRCRKRKQVSNKNIDDSEKNEIPDENDKE